MKKLSFALAALPAAVLAFTFACDGATTTPCTADADCVGTTNSAGEDTPVCDLDLEVCVPEGADECAAAVDCQIAYNAGDDASAECDADADCGADEICASGFDDVGFCVATDDGSGACEDVGGEVVSVTKAEGGAADACLDPAGDRACEDGICNVQ